MAVPLICYCFGSCPNHEPEGTCVAKPNSFCYAIAEEVYHEETDSFATQRTYGCLPPEEASLMQCKGNLSPHEVPKSILCCDDDNLCNKKLNPIYQVPTPSPGTTDDHLQTQLLIWILSLSMVLILVMILTYLVYKRYKRSQLKSEHNNYNFDETHNLFGAQEKSSLKDMIDQSVSSGSGSGLPLLVQRTIGKQIDLVQSIGKGRYGEVWKANWRGEELAAKVFFTSEELSWQRETSIYQTVLLRHPNILGFVAADIRGTGGWTQLLLITDYHENGSLYDYLKLHLLDITETLKLAHSAICGICHLHTEIYGKLGKPAIAHRDIKSKNILVKRDGTCAIADLNLAVRYDGQAKGPDIVPKISSGTKRYMAPEILDESIATQNFDSFLMADMYSYALVLWEIARRCAFDGEVDEYAVPYYEFVSHDPSVEEMKKVVCTETIRPSSSPRWDKNLTLLQLSKVMQECWHTTPCVRLTSLRVKKSLAKLRHNPDIKINL